MVEDKVGLGWRPELAASIQTHLERIDVLEVILDDWLDASSRTLGALRLLGSQRPVMLHGVGLGLATTCRLATKRVDALARLVEKTRPVLWSEHLAFVRAGGIEIGHLAAPPRNQATLEAASANARLVSRIVGARPALENVATLISPPGSTMDEADWVSGAIAQSDGCGLLLDLHNLYANSINFGLDPMTVLERFPLKDTRVVHLAGGRPIRSPAGEVRLLDDHLNAVPDPVFTLLERVAERVDQSLYVVVERDGAYPEMSTLLAELDRARDALARGRRACTLKGTAA